MITCAEISPAAKAKFPKTVAGLEADELYPHCPRCNGSRYVYAITQPGNEFWPSRGEDFACPLCHATGEADAQQALEFIDDWQYENAQ